MTGDEFATNENALNDAKKSEKPKRGHIFAELTKAQ